MSDSVRREAERPGAAPGFVHLLFFLSGIAALVYEASWTRLFGLVIGNTA